MPAYFRKHIYLPQDHGSWVFVISPLLVGFSAGRQFSLGTLYLGMAALAAFLIRQPIMVAIKAYSGRRPRADLPAARFWMIVYGVILLLTLIGLVTQGFLFVLFLALPGIPVFAWYLWLVSRREERRQARWRSLQPVYYPWQHPPRIGWG